MTIPNSTPMDEQIRSSKLIQALESKLSDDANKTQFDYMGELNRLSKVVAPQISQIIKTFPQYTPHDWALHVRRLFSLSDRLIGEDHYAAMYAAELFVLAASLYAHDWGMAVSDDERDAIIAGGKSSDNSTFVLLDNESIELRKFAKNNNLRIEPDGSCPTLKQDNYWREYVRLTHAWRSGFRAKRFFEESDGGIAQSVAAACEGHWLDLSVIDSESRFPAMMNVLDQRINLRAVVIYVRIVDLFDIGEDRTPYALWRFIAPRNTKSSLEWSKHRALRPVNVEPYQPGRRIVVDGTASDPDLWASLLDLRDYIEHQLRGCMELISRYPDARHTLDLAPIIKWNVKPQGFNPIQIRFEFDRARTFEILSDEIYQGDPYIFLRELLQNSIDAIKVRREKQLDRPQDGIADGLIEFKVTHGKDGDATIICTDNGIGMDEYILRNYFALAGVSYYRSPDFEKEGLKFDPISRFGIGILSCFMVADSIEITTFRDPRFYSGSRPLRLVIPAIDKQFRVYPESPDCNVGTKVIINVQGAKIKKAFTAAQDDGKKVESHLKITDYLSTIAGFVEFPILVEENGQRTVIVHPDIKPQDIYSKFDNVQIRQILHEPNWDKFVAPQNIHDAKRFLVIKTIDFAKDLCMKGFEGWVNFVIPKDPECDFKELEIDEGFILFSRGINKYIKIRWSQEDRNNQPFSRSCTHPFSKATYQNGILIPLTEENDYRMQYSRVPLSRSKRESYQLHEYDIPLPHPRYRVGLRLLSTGRPDISRTELVDIEQTWEKKIRSKLIEYLWNSELKNFQSKDLLDRFLTIGRFAAIYQIMEKELLSNYLTNFLPIPYLKKDGTIDFFENVSICPEEISIASDDTVSLVKKHAKYLFYSGYSEQKLKEWKGDICLLISSDLDFSNSVVLTKAFELARITFKSKYRWTRIRFLHSAVKKHTPIMQEIWKKMEIKKPVNAMELIEKFSTSITPITEEVLDSVESYYNDNADEYFSLSDLYHKSMAFNQPFNNYFAYGNQYLNLTHPLTQGLLRCHFALSSYKNNKMYSPEIIGNFSDALTELENYIEDEDLLSEKELNKKITALRDLLLNLDIKQWIINLPSLSYADFVPQTVKRMGQYFKFVNIDFDKSFKGKLSPFGQVITQWPLITKKYIKK